MIHCDSCGVVPVPEEDLPVELPSSIHMEGCTGSVLASDDASAWRCVPCPKCGK